MLKISLTMEPFISTIELPLKFLFSYIKYEGESYLHRQFVRADEIDFNYIPERDVIYVQKILPRNDTRGELLDEDTNTREYELSFPEFVQEAFEEQLKITKGLIYQKSKSNGDDQDLKLYIHILLNCLDFQISIDKTPELNFRPDLNNFISKVLTYVYNKFERDHSKTPEIQRVKRYYKTRTDSNCTGFKLKPPPRNAPLKDIIDRLYKNEFITKSKNSDSLNQFFNGEMPKHRIDWNKELHELKYFIDVIIEGKILLNKPGQQWKNMQNIFTCQGEELKRGWYKKHNKLKSPEKRLAIEEIASMLSPHI